MAVTIFTVMPVIPKPADRGPLFGDKTVILFGGIDKEAMRRWQERVRSAKKSPTGNPGEDNDNGDNAAD